MLWLDRICDRVAIEPCQYVLYWEFSFDAVCTPSFEINLTSQSHKTRMMRLHESKDLVILA